MKRDDRLPVAIIATAAAIAAQAPVLAVSGLVDEWVSWRVCFAVIAAGALLLMLLAARELSRDRSDRWDGVGFGGGDGANPDPQTPVRPGGPAVVHELSPGAWLAIEAPRPQLTVVHYDRDTEENERG